MNIKKARFFKILSSEFSKIVTSIHFSLTRIKFLILFRDAVVLTNEVLTIRIVVHMCPHHLLIESEFRWKNVAITKDKQSPTQIYKNEYTEYIE